MRAFDDVSGDELKPEMVRAARTEEMAYFKKIGVYQKMPRKVCLQENCREPIGVRWVDINKGDRLHPNYRSRLVAK